MSIRVHTFDALEKESGVFAYACSAIETKGVVASLKRNILAAVLPSEKDNAAAFLLALTGSGRILREEEPIAAVLQGGDRELSLRKFVRDGYRRTAQLHVRTAWHVCAHAHNRLVAVECNSAPLLQIGPRKSIQLDGNSLSLEDVVKIGRGELLVEVSVGSSLLT